MLKLGGYWALALTVGVVALGAASPARPARLTPASAQAAIKLDFNFAYNPACSVSEHYNCPIPPKGNALRVAIRAGEMDSHYY